MNFPVILNQLLQSKLEGYQLGKLKDISQSISDMYRNNSGSGNRLVESSLQVLVYSLVRMPATFGAVADALGYTLDMLGEEQGQIKSLLDVGAGTGSASWAVDSLLDIDNIRCIEREREMSKLGKELMAEGSDALKNAEWIDKDLTKLDVSTIKSADLVLASYVMNEMSESDRQTLVKKLWTLTDKVLLIIEPGTPKGYQQLMSTRQILLEQGANLIAPCTHTDKCRLSDGDWCHFTTRIQRNKIHKLLKDGDVPYEDEKYFYMAFSKQNTQMAKCRILRHPYIEKGQITLQVCTAKQNYTKVVRKKDGDIFKQAKKSKCGDSLDIE